MHWLPRYEALASFESTQIKPQNDRASPKISQKNCTNSSVPARVCAACSRNRTLTISIESTEHCSCGLLHRLWLLLYVTCDIIRIYVYYTYILAILYVFTCSCPPPNPFRPFITVSILLRTSPLEA